jgi:serine/threonine-protein kinase
MLLSIPPRPSDRPRLIPGLPLRAGDSIAGRHRALSLLRTDRACAHFAARQDGSNTKVEVQVLLGNDEAVEPVHLRFLADARKAAALQSPTLQRILQVGVTPDGHPFVVREAQRGDVLASLLKTLGSLATENAVDIALAVCDALECAHDHGVVHGELDASSVHVTWTREGPTQVAVAGLGTSRALAMLRDDDRSPASASRATRAPELGRGEDVDARADIWGVGVLLYTMLAGAAPFGASPSTMDVTASLDVPAMLAGVPDALAEIVDACLARDRRQRPQSAAALAAKLAPFGTRPVFEKRAPLLVVDTGPYDALVLERVLAEAGPSELSIDVAIEPSVSDVATAIRERPSLSAMPTPVVEIQPSAPSVPPVAMSIVPPAAPVGVQLAREGSSARLTRTVLFAAAAVPALAEGDLPPAASTTRSIRRPAAGAAAPAPAPAPAAAPAREPALAEPVSRSAAAAPVQPPQPKASDDDLRRFLDDRR